MYVRVRRAGRNNYMCSSLYSAVFFFFFSFSDPHEQVTTTKGVMWLDPAASFLAPFFSFPALLSSAFLSHVFTPPSGLLSP